MKFINGGQWVDENIGVNHPWDQGDAIENKMSGFCYRLSADMGNPSRKNCKYLMGLAIPRIPESLSTEFARYGFGSASFLANDAEHFHSAKVFTTSVWGVVAPTAGRADQSAAPPGQEAATAACTSTTWPTFCSTRPCWPKAACRKTRRLM